MALIGRLFVILFGFLAACLVAGMIVVVAVLFPEFSDLGAGPVEGVLPEMVQRHVAVSHQVVGDGQRVVEGVAGDEPAHHRTGQRRVLGDGSQPGRAGGLEQS